VDFFVVEARQPFPSQSLPPAPAMLFKILAVCLAFVLVAA